MNTELRQSLGKGIDSRIAGGELIIDLDALRANYRALCQLSKPARTAGVVKANAYGIGADIVVPALLNEGCEDFFVATPEEGIAARSYAPEARIFVLSGLFGREVAALYAHANLVPVLNSAQDLAIWEAHCGANSVAAPCALHVDTGMSRLGLSLSEALAFAEENALTRALNITLLMSHLACADEPEHPLNQGQLTAFQMITHAFPGVPASLANSYGITLGNAFHHALTRPGIALYTGVPGQTSDPVVSLSARVVQVRDGRKGEGVSYGSTVLERESIIAVAAVGYADGYLRSSSGSGVPLRATNGLGGQGFLHGKHVPILGRITMDLTLFDVTELGADAVRPNDRIELVGPNMPIDQVAAAAGTISYEILTSLGNRYHRRILGAD